MTDSNTWLNAWKIAL